jgi:hypothetical protein
MRVHCAIRWDHRCTRERQTSWGVCIIWRLFNLKYTCLFGRAQLTIPRSCHLPNLRRFEVRAGQYFWPKICFRRQTTNLIDGRICHCVTSKSWRIAWCESNYFAHLLWICAYTRLSTGIVIPIDHVFESFSQIKGIDQSGLKRQLRFWVDCAFQWADCCRELDWSASKLQRIEAYAYVITGETWIPNWFIHGCSS